MAGEQAAEGCTGWSDIPAPFISISWWMGLDLPEAPCASTWLWHDTRWFIYLIIAQQAGMSLVIDGRCVPAAAGLLVSPAQNSLKDSSAGTLVTPFHFFCSSSLYHSLSFPLTTFYQFRASLHHRWIVIFFLPSLFFPPTSCWSADANWASDLCKFNLNNGGRLQRICVRYAWVPMRSCEDESGSHPLFCLSQSLTGWPRLYLAWSRTHAGVPPAGPCSP